MLNCSAGNKFNVESFVLLHADFVVAWEKCLSMTSKRRLLAFLFHVRIHRPCRIGFLVFEMSLVFIPFPCLPFSDPSTSVNSHILMYDLQKNLCDVPTANEREEFFSMKTTSVSFATVI